MHHLAGPPNVVCLSNVYEDKSNVCLVMEVRLQRLRHPGRNLLCPIKICGENSGVFGMLF